MLEIVDGFYADVFGIGLPSVWALQTPTVHADVTAPQVGAECHVLALRRHHTVRIIAPPDLDELLTDEVAGRSAAEVFTAGFFNRMLDGHIDSLIGPNWRGYVDHGGSGPTPPTGVLASVARTGLRLRTCGHSSGTPTGRKEDFPRTLFRSSASGDGAVENSWLRPP